MDIMTDGWLAATIAGTISSIVSWILSKRKYKAEASAMEAGVKSSELDNVEAAIGIYRMAAEDLQSELQSTRIEMGKLREVNSSLQLKIEEQNRHIINIEEKIETYQRSLDTSQKENHKLRVRLDRLDGGVVAE